MYRKVPSDLLEGTKRGNIFSLVAVFTMATLFYYETRAFLATERVAYLALDQSEIPRVRLNFNITMMDLSCDLAIVDVVSVLGTEQNVTQHVQKWSLTAEGVKDRFVGRNKYQADVALNDVTVQESLAELHMNGEDAVHLSEETLQMALDENIYVFVDYYADWCWHCKVLEPTWEALAELMNDVAAEEVEKEREEDINEANKRREIRRMREKEMAQGHAFDDDYIGMHDDYIPEYSPEEHEEAIKVNIPVLVVKVDCVAHKDYCQKQAITTLPTLQLFVDGEKYGSQYKGDRTIMAMTQYLATTEQKVEDEPGHLEKAEEKARARIDLPIESHEWTRRRRNMRWNSAEHPGCQLSGYLMLDRVPGNFHIRAKSQSQTLIPAMTNVSHEIHSLYFGEPYHLKQMQSPKNKEEIPRDVETKINPVDGNAYVTKHLHEAYHHHLKVVSTGLAYTNSRKKTEQGRIYQILQQSQLSHYHADDIPEAKFVYDLSPVAVSYSTKKRKWYEYLTSLMAIVGGAFTVVGIVETSVGMVTRRKHS